MEWGDEQIVDLINTLASMVGALNVQHQCLIDLFLAVEALEARSTVTMSAYNDFSARIAKLENFAYGDGK